MKKEKQPQKALYEKIGIVIGIIAGVCAILAFVFNLNKSTNTTNNEINMGDKSAILIGDNNTVNYGDMALDNIQSSKPHDSSIFESDTFSVVASYKTNPVQISERGIDVLITATPSFEAEHVTISYISDTNEEGIFYMHKNVNDWQFVANFYIKGTYTITITAFDTEGKSTSDTFTFVY